MKKLILLVVLGLFLLACDSVSTVDDKVGDSISKASEVSEVQTFTAFVIYDGYKGERLIKEPASQKVCKLELKIFLEKNIEFFKTNSTDIQVCCLESGSNRNLYNDFCINDKDFILFKIPKSAVYYNLYQKTL